MAKISKIIKNDLCLGCGLCEAVSNGICKMALTQRGFYEPKMIRDNRNQYIGRICPGITIHNRNQSKHLSVWGNVVQVSNAWSTDNGIRRQSSSGGSHFSLSYISIGVASGRRCLACRSAREHLFI